MASQNGHCDVVQSLLGAAVDVNIARSDVSDIILITSLYVDIINSCERMEGKQNIWYINACLIVLSVSCA